MPNDPGHIPDANPPGTSDELSREIVNQKIRACGSRL